MTYCIKCGKQNLDTAKFCTTCGTTLTVHVSPKENYPITSSSKNKSSWKYIAIMAFVGLSAATYFMFFNKKQGNETKKQGTELNQIIPGLYPYTSQRILTNEDMKNLTQYNFRVMRNEIYARHGYIFQKTEMRNYFTNQKWYTPLYNDVSSMLSEMEKKNIEFIKQYEKVAGE